MIKINFFRNTGDEKSGGGDASPANSPENIAMEQKRNEAADRVTDFRLRIDSLYLTAKQFPPSRHISLAVTAFQQARQFCGVIKKELGVPNPYPESMNPESKKVEPRAEQGAVIPEVVKHPDEVSQIKQMRSMSEDLITEMAVYMDLYPYKSVIQFVAQNKVLENLLSGKMWLDERLGEFASDNNKKAAK